MYFRAYCARITPIMFNNLSTYNLDELVKPLPFLIESSDEDEACYSAMKKLVDDCSDNIYSAGIDNDLVMFKDKEDRFLYGYGAFVAVPANR